MLWLLQKRLQHLVPKNQKDKTLVFRVVKQRQPNEAHTVFFTRVGTAMLILLVAAFVFLDFSEDPPKHLAAYPSAEWRGGPDGGEYYEVTQASPPYFYVQIRCETGRLWKEGWFKLNVETKEQALNSIAG
ncbi:hypothetical protein [Metapseudomonas otitidis]|nr:hypothetical protein [Pseudomonas otitidis]